MADIFVSYTKSDRVKANWIGKELEALGHKPHVHELEIKPGENFYAWMRKRLDAADHALCVISDEYLRAPHSIWEFDAAVRQAADKRPGFLLPVVVNLRQLRVPVIIDHLNRCELQGLSDQTMRTTFRDFVRELKLQDAAAKPLAPTAAISNVPIRVPTHFIGRDETLIDIDKVLRGGDDRMEIIALHGLRGVGKTVLAAAYTELHRSNYRVTWWVRAQTESSMRADLVALAVRLGWVASDEKEEGALTVVAERLRQDGEGILLVCDNAVDADVLTPYLPRGGSARVIVTSNAHAWRALAAPVEIQIWPKETGGDFLMARTGRASERAAAEDLSETLGGLPLAHEQAGAYCERLEIALAEYAKRFNAAPARMLNTERDAPTDYHDKLTVAKTFALAIDEAAKLHPGAESLLAHAAALAPEPIPLFLFAEAREKFGEPLASVLAGDGLDETVSALRAFALINRETVVDERDPAISTETIRLHRLVHEIASARYAGKQEEDIWRALIEALAAVYPEEVFNNPNTWSRARRLDAIALALCNNDRALRAGTAQPATYLMNQLAAYRYKALGAYASARPLYELALAVREQIFGPEDPATVVSLNNLADLLQATGYFPMAQLLFERALRANENLSGPAHPSTATSLNNLAGLLLARAEVAEARPLFERALGIREEALGPNHPLTASSLNNLALLLQAEGNLAAAQPLFERALTIREKELGPDHPNTAQSLNNLAGVYQAQGKLAAGRTRLERALVIHEKVLGCNHPAVATSLNSLGALLVEQNDLAAAQALFERALAIRENALGLEHPDTATSLNNLASIFSRQGDFVAAQPLIERALAIREKALGPEHPDTAKSLNSLASLLRNRGELAPAQPTFERALAICELRLGPDHPDTGVYLNNLASLLQARGDLAQARLHYERALAIFENSLGLDHPDTKAVRRNLSALGC